MTGVMKSTILSPSSTSRRLIRSLYNVRFKPAVDNARRSLRNGTCTYHNRSDHGNSSSQYYSTTSLSLSNPATPQTSVSLLNSPFDNRYHYRTSFGHDRRHLCRFYGGNSVQKSPITEDRLSFLGFPAQLPPSSSSILKQDDDELSPEELRLKNALTEFMNEPTRAAETSDSDDYLLENLQRAYMDLEYWEEALKIEAYKCHMYFREDTDEYADSIHAQGKFFLRQEDFSNSKRLYEEALEYFERTDNAVQQGHVLISLAGWYFFRSQLDEALDCLQRSESMLDPNPALLYKCLDNQGLIYRLWGEFDAALDKYQQALQVIAIDDFETRSALKLHIADMYLALEETIEALQVYQELMMELPSNSDEYALGIRGVLLHNIASIHADQGEYELALKDFREALSAKQSAGGEDNPEVAKTLNSLGALHAGLGEKQAALEYFQQALLIARIHTVDGENYQTDPDVVNALQNISIIEKELAGKR